MRNEHGAIKKVKAGFSWTTFFFGVLVPLFRGDFKWFLVMIVANLFTVGLANFIFIFKYNSWYISDLQDKGYKIVK